MNKNILLLLVGIAIVPIGCTMAPKYARPSAPVPTEWPAGAAYGGARAATNTPAAPDLRWREFFTDVKLQQVIGTSLTNNRDLRVAVLNVERARAMYGIQRAGLFPALNAIGSGSKQSTPADLSSGGSRQTTERYDANLGVASWEIDFFGRIRSFKDRALD
jgi:outer membrane protein, multidrug efflux system